MKIVGTTYRILTPEQRRFSAALFCLVTIGMILEALSIGMIVPAIAVMTEPSIADRYPYMQSLLEALGQPSQTQLVVTGVVALVGLYLLKALFLTFLAFWQNSFIYSIGADISKRLFAGYLSQPWTFHLQRNSAGLVRNVVTEAAAFSKFVMLPIAILIGEFMVVLGITTVLFIVEPSGAIFVISALGLAALTFQRMMRRSLLRWGEARQHHEGVRMRHLQEGLGGVKDIKVLGREADFIAQYWEHAAQSALASQRLATVQELPRHMLELLAMVGLALLVLTMMYQGSQPDMMVPVVGLFATAAFRLMPSITRIMTALQSLRYGAPIANLLCEELVFFEAGERHKPAPPSPLFFRHTLSLDTVRFDYPGADIPALRDITLAISRGTSVGFIGSSGAGKTTLVDIILGLLPPKSGRVAVDGIDIQTNLRGWQALIGYVPQNIFLTDDSLRRNIAFGLSDDEIDEEAVRRALDAAQLDEFVASLPQSVETRVGERGVRLSGGQRQRIGIARALYHDPQVLVLDEATSALDSDTESGVMDAIKALRGEKTILIVAHRLSTVANCDRLIRLDKGTIAEEGSFHALVQEAPAVAGRTGSLRRRDAPRAGDAGR